MICKLGLHSWLKWSEPHWMPDGRMLQLRLCRDCGKRIVREVAGAKQSLPAQNNAQETKP